jgi:hypothetical protein
MAETLACKYFVKVLENCFNRTLISKVNVCITAEGVRQNTQGLAAVPCRGGEGVKG